MKASDLLEGEDYLYSKSKDISYDGSYGVRRVRILEAPVRQLGSRYSFGRLREEQPPHLRFRQAGPRDHAVVEFLQHDGHHQLGHVNHATEWTEHVDPRTGVVGAARLVLPAEAGSYRGVVQVVPLRMIRMSYWEYQRGQVLHAEAVEREAKKRQRIAAHAKLIEARIEVLNLWLGEYGIEMSVGGSTYRSTANVMLKPTDSHYRESSWDNHEAVVEGLEHLIGQDTLDLVVQDRDMKGGDL